MSGHIVDAITQAYRAGALRAQIRKHGPTFTSLGVRRLADRHSAAAAQSLHAYCVEVANDLARRLG